MFIKATGNPTQALEVYEALWVTTSSCDGSFPLALDAILFVENLVEIYLRGLPREAPEISSIG